MKKANKSDCLSSIVFSVIGPNLDPDVVSEKFEFNGAETWRKSEVHDPSGFIYRNSGWKIDISSGNLESLMTNLDYVVNQIELAGEPTDFHDPDSNAELEIVFFQLPTTNLIVNPRLLSLLHLWKISLTISIFES